MLNNNNNNDMIYRKSVNDHASRKNISMWLQNY